MMKWRWNILTVMVIAACSGFINAFATEDARLLRQPHIHENRVVFVYAGDIWVVSAEGGQARKLTSFEGMELFPKFSPDGRWIAFSGEYSGTRQVYVIPAEGGMPKQLTYYPDVGRMPPRGGWDNITYDWTPDGRKILVRSNRTPYGQRIGKYFLVDAFTESLEQALQIPEGGPCSLSPDGKKLAYSIISREFRTWKRYKAGRAQNIWIYDLVNDTIEQMTDYPGTDNFPMWVGSRIYFTSDRRTVDSDDPRTLNIFAYDLGTKEIRKVTHFNEYDCLWPSRGKGGIVFENGGYIHILDPATEKVRKLNVTLNDDRPHARPEIRNVSRFVESFYVSPSGKRAIFAARGEVFTVPAEHGDIRNISRTPGVREINVDWSPDGKYISYLSEASGDYELYLKKHKSDEPAMQMTKNTGAWITGYVWSPNSEKIAIGDKRNRLRILDVESKRIQEVDQNPYSGIGGYRWSSDGQWLTYSKNAENGMSSVWVYSLDDDRKVQLTTDATNDYGAVFGSEGKLLFFISNRDFSFRNRNFQARLYVATLTRDMESPFAPRSDEEEVKEEEEKEKGKKEEGKKEAEEKEKDEEEKLVIDIDGFNNRVVAMPMGTGSYRGLTPVKGGLLYARGNNLYKYDMESREEKQIMSNVRAFYLTADGKKFIYRSGDDYGIAAVKPNVKASEGRLDLSEMKMKVDPAVEWKQIYTDAWRIMRDWFYDPGLHGVDWKKMHDRYEVLVPHVSHRADLDYILGELIGELNAGHTYVFSGDDPGVERVDVGLLGCELSADGPFYRIVKIFPGENWSRNLRSPLTESGVDIKVGEYLIGIDGEIVRTDQNPYRFLENKENRQVTLLINDTPSRENAREVNVRPIRSELALRHYEWELRNRAIVDSLSGGRVGYIYVPNTSFNGFESFYKGWQEQYTKDALLIDERYNGGGSLPSPMIFDMAHPTLQYWATRHTELRPTPFRVHEGPKIMLINGYSSSGGDAFPDYFRTMKLGPLMGQKTWGGLIGYGYSPSFVDNGRMAVPSSAYVNTEGEWDVEYVGVDPDIEVFDDPTMIQAGREPMLEKAVEYLLEELKKNPPKKVKKPRGPDRH